MAHLPFIPFSTQKMIDSCESLLNEALSFIFSESQTTQCQVILSETHCVT